MVYWQKDLADENGQLLPGAAIAEEFILKNTDGSYDYEIIDIGMGKGRNILKFDLDKIERKTKPFINAEVCWSFATRTKCRSCLECFYW